MGINQEDRSDSLIVLTPSDHMLAPDFPGLPQDEMVVQLPLIESTHSREDTQFISWEHPIIRNGLDLVLSGDTGSCAVSFIEKQSITCRYAIVELIYVVEARPKHLHLTRFLPA